MYAKEAKARQGTRTDKPKHGGKDSTKFGKARDQAGAALGVSGRTVRSCGATGEGQRVECVACAERTLRISPTVAVMRPTNEATTPAIAARIRSDEEAHIDAAIRRKTAPNTSWLQNSQVARGGCPRRSRGTMARPRAKDNTASMTKRAPKKRSEAGNQPGIKIKITRLPPKVR